MKLISILLLCIAARCAAECTFNDTTNGWMYDITSLIRFDEDWYLRRGDNNIPFSVWINFCRPTIMQQCSNYSAGCSEWAGNSFANLGNYFQTSMSLTNKSESGDGFLLTFNGGDGGRSFSINFECDEQDYNVGAPIYIQEKPHLHYLFYWYTAAACGDQIPKPPSNMLAWWEITLIALFSVLFVVFVVGLLVNKFMFKKSGIEIIPGYDTVSNMIASCKRKQYEEIEEQHQ